MALGAKSSTAVLGGASWPSVSLQCRWKSQELLHTTADETQQCWIQLWHWYFENLFFEASHYVSVEVSRVILHGDMTSATLSHHAVDTQYVLVAPMQGLLFFPASVVTNAVTCNTSTQLAVASHLGKPGKILFTLSTLKSMDVYYASYNSAQEI